MIRLHAIVEGQTEETFVKSVLAPEFAIRSIVMDVHRITTGRRRGRVFRGGISGYSQLQNDLRQWMKQDQNPDAWFTTMIDLYALPNDFPGYSECGKRGEARKRVECLEQQLHDNISHPRFIPYIQLHEFEALLFSDPEKFEFAFPREPRAIQELKEIRNAFPSPEHIDDRPDLAPSRRITRLLPDYKKTVAGPLVIQHIGLSTLRQECPHFGRWIDRIEGIGDQ